jgi:putative transposase
LYPEPGQQGALARAFGCARVVFNDAHAAKEPYPTSKTLSRALVTRGKLRRERY